jgi:hypothetical protein
METGGNKARMGCLANCKTNSRVLPDKAADVTTPAWYLLLDARSD